MSQTDEPAVQASYMKNLFATLEARGEVDLELHDPTLCDAVDRAGRMTWLPIELNQRAVEAVCKQLGEERGLALLADCVHAQFDTPLWRSFISGGLSLMGRDPARLGRWIPRAGTLVFRGCGEWAVGEQGEAELEIVLNSVPVSLLDDGRWLRSLGVGMTTLFVLCGVEGGVEFEGVDRPTRRVRYRLRWSGGSAGT